MAATRPRRTRAAERAPERVTPRSRRGERTREALVAAARAIFERDGFLDARIVDITRAAGVATGSFYTYFADKDAVFAAVLEVVQDEMLHPQMPEADGERGPIARLEAANRAYLHAYQRNARLMALLEQVATIDDGFRQLRLQRATAFAQRNARAIARLQEQGLADRRLDPHQASRALSVMVSRTAYGEFVLGDRSDFEELVATLTRLWANALGIPDDAEEDPWTSS